jgi:hypothetical protein
MMLWLIGAFVLLWFAIQVPLGSMSGRFLRDDEL